MTVSRRTDGLRKAGVRREELRMREWVGRRRLRSSVSPVTALAVAVAVGVMVVGVLVQLS
ncbi:hypothetical protein GCM10010315_50900 [Streptomyces luteosporeus]|uniref:Uncharacterized protein n=1 Tax=Streptomyces luteosporeus TaxID=173856 RepID=A0ABN3U318_9ACTN